MSHRWTKPPEVERDDLRRALPRLGITADLDEPFPCVLPGHDKPAHMAVFDGRTLAYRCFGHGAE